MTFWKEVLVDFLGSLFAGVALVIGYVLIQWFLAATDVVIGYGWRFDGTIQQPRNFRPSFDIRNRSKTRTYYLANVAYLRDGRPIASFDNQSVWGVELKPGTIQFAEAAPIRNFAESGPFPLCEVHVRLQNGRTFWLRGVGPGNIRMGTIQRIAFWLRDKIESSAVPME